jgi:hypothetical protein
MTVALGHNSRLKQGDSRAHRISLLVCGSSAEDSNPPLRLTNGNGCQLSLLSRMSTKPVPIDMWVARWFGKLYVFELCCS